jgi:hypothetical protein
MAQGAPGSPEPKPEESAKPPQGEGATQEGEGAKPGQAAPTPEPESLKPAPTESEGTQLSLGELVRDGFEIRGSDFQPRR